MTELTLDILQRAVEGSAAAFRCRRTLQPAGGEGDKVFPPTFAGAVYATEERRRLIARRTADGSDEQEWVSTPCVLLDTVQSQANRMELALQDAVDEGRIDMPLVVVDFSEHDPTGDIEADEQAGRFVDAVGRVTSLQAPHRLADAIIRDSELDGVPFRSSERGKALNRVSQANATPLFELCPTALVFGMWDSTGPKGGLGPKFERAMVSEIIGVGTKEGDLRRGVRWDPLGIREAAKVSRIPDGTWSVADPKDKDVVAPSKINHSSVPFPETRERKTDDNYFNGVTIEYAEQTTTLSLICLRRLRFPMKDDADEALDNAARTALAALGLYAATLASDAGIDLRSRCLLWPDGQMRWELLDRPGAEPVPYALSVELALGLLMDAVDVARRAGLPWQAEPLVLKPSEQLVKLVRLSQLMETKGKAAQAA